MDEYDLSTPWWILQKHDLKACISTKKPVLNKKNTFEGKIKFGMRGIQCRSHIRT